MENFLSQRNRNMKRGFSLVELMVSLTVFSVVMLTSTGTLLIMIDINAKAQAVYSSTTNLTFALDNITREIRTGYHYDCYTTHQDSPEPTPGDTFPSEPDFTGTNNGNCGEGNSIVFTREKDGIRMGYRLNNGILEQKDGLGSDWIALTSTDVFVETLVLQVENTATQDAGNETDQPVVYLNISGYVNNGLDNKTEFSIQSRIVQRRLDII